MAASLFHSPNRTDVRPSRGNLSTAHPTQNLPLSEVARRQVDAPEPKFTTPDGTSPQARSYDITSPAGTIGSGLERELVDGSVVGDRCFFCSAPYGVTGPVLVAVVIAHLVDCRGILNRRTAAAR